jgi:hypothetical protein
MDLSDVLNTYRLCNGFFRYLSSVTKTPCRMELFLNAIWWVWPLSQTEESDGAISFSNSVPSCEGDFPYSSCGDVPVILHTLMWGRLPIFVTWIRFRYSSYPHVRETSHIRHMETFPSFFMPSCEGDFPYSSHGDVPVILHTLLLVRRPFPTARPDDAILNLQLNGIYFRHGC